MLRRMLRLIWGDDVDRALRPILIVGFAGSLAGSAAWTFIGIWRWMSSATTSPRHSRYRQRALS